MLDTYFREDDYDSFKKLRALSDEVFFMFYMNLFIEDLKQTWLAKSPSLFAWFSYSFRTPSVSATSSASSFALSLSLFASVLVSSAPSKTSFAC